MIDKKVCTPAVPALRRRTLLGGALATALSGAGCSSSPLKLRPTPPPAPTVTSLTAEIPFYVAHRGGADNWPEMTAYAYEQAAKLPGLKALEISVCRSSDGVLVCSHDPSTERLTGVRYTIANETWATLSKLKVTAAHTLDPTQPARPLSRLDDIVDLYIDRFVIFIEPKVDAAVDQLMAKMASFNQPQRVVWKQPINQHNFSVAKKHGFSTWGYVLNEPGHLGDNLKRYAAEPEIDLLGVQRSKTNSFVANVVAAATNSGKETIMWNIRDVEDRSRAMRLGCVGLMTSNIAQVPSIPL